MAFLVGNFLTFREWSVHFTFYIFIFSNTLFNRFFILFKYYFFIYYLFIFNNYTSFNIFLFNILIIIIEKMIWKMSGSPSDLIGYCLLEKKNQTVWWVTDH